MALKKLLILGAGQYGKVAKEIAESIGEFSEIAYLDDNSPLAIGKLNEYEKYSDLFDVAIVAIGIGALRIEWLEKLEKAGFEIPVLIHPTAYVSPSAVIGKGRVVRALAVFHKYEIPVELRVAVERADLIELLLGERSGFHGVSQRVGEIHELGADFQRAGFHLALDGTDLFRHIRAAVAAGAGLQQLGFFQRTDKIVIRIGAGSVSPVGAELAHMAVGAGEKSGMGAARTHERLELRMLRLELLRTGAGVGIIRKPDLIVEFQHIVGRHGRQTGIRKSGGLVSRGEIILHMALAAGEHRGIHIGQILAHGIGKICMRDYQLIAGVAVAGVAADGLGHLCDGLIEVQRIRADAVRIGKDGEVRGLAGDALGLGMRPSGLRHVLNGKGVPPGAAVELAEGIALIDRGNDGILRYIIDDFAVFFISHVGSILIRVFALPVRGLDDLNGRSCLHHLSALVENTGVRRLSLNDHIDSNGKDQNGETQKQYAIDKTTG